MKTDRFVPDTYGPTAQANRQGTIFHWDEQGKQGMIAAGKELMREAVRPLRTNCQPDRSFFFSGFSTFTSIHRTNRKEHHADYPLSHPVARR